MDSTLKAEDLPEIERSELDDRALNAFFDGVAAQAVQLTVMAKGAPHRRTDGAALTLDEGRRAFMAGEVGALQLRYVHRGAVVMDTLMRQGPGLTRLARMRQL